LVVTLLAVRILCVARLVFLWWLGHLFLAFTF